MRFLGKHKVMAWILAVALVLGLMSDFSIFDSAKRVYAGDFNGGFGSYAADEDNKKGKQHKFEIGV